MDLDELLIDVDNFSDEELEDLGREMYREFFLNHERYGLLTLHNGETVVFHEDRYDHAFRCSPNRARNPHSKAAVARDRIARMGWIKRFLREMRKMPNAGLSPSNPRIDSISSGRSAMLYGYGPAKKGAGAFPPPTVPRATIFAAIFSEGFVWER